MNQRYCLIPGPATLTECRQSRSMVQLKADKLQLEVLDLKNKTDDERVEFEARLTNTIKELESAHAGLLQEIETLKSSKDMAYDQLMNEMHSMQVRKDQQASAAAELQSTIFARQLKGNLSKIYDLEAAMASLRSDYISRSATYLHQIEQLQTTARETAMERDATAHIKDDEVSQVRNLQSLALSYHQRRTFMLDRATERRNADSKFLVSYVVSSSPSRRRFARHMKKKIGHWRHVRDFLNSLWAICDIDVT